MLWKIVRPRFWIIDRKLQKANRLLIVAIIYGVLLLGQFVYTNYILDWLSVFASQEAVRVIAAFLPTSLMILLVSAVVGIDDTIHQLFLSPNLPLLMSSPIPNRTIYIVKLFSSTPGLSLPLILYAALMTLFGAARGAGALYYIYIALLLTAVTLLVSALAISLVIILARVITPQKVRTWMPILLAVSQIPLILWMTSENNILTTSSRSVLIAMNALLNIEQLGILTLEVIGTSVLVNLGAYKLFDKSFYEGWNRIQIVPTRKAPRSRTGFSTRINRTYKDQSPHQALATKELKELRRDPRRIFGLIGVPILFSPIMWGLVNSPVRSIIFWFLLFFTFMLQGSVLPDALIAFGREGRNIRLYKSQPVEMSTVLRGKFLGGSWRLAAIFWAAAYILVGILMDYSFWIIVLLAVLVGWASVVTSALGVGYGAWVANFTAEDSVRKSVSQIHQYLSWALSILCLLPMLSAVLWLIIHLLPNSSVAVPIWAVLDQNATSAFFTGQVWVLLVILAAQGVCLLLVRGIWRLAVRRLNRLEV